VEVKFIPGADKNIKVTPTAGILMKYTPASVFDDKEFFQNKDLNRFYELVLKCIDKIYDGDEVYDAKEYTKEQLEEYINSLDIKSYNAIKMFMETTPNLYHKIEYTNSLGNSRSIELTTLTDFFTLG
jgi:hypothetical protein